MHTRSTSILVRDVYIYIYVLCVWHIYTCRWLSRTNTHSTFINTCRWLSRTSTRSKSINTCRRLSRTYTRNDVAVRFSSVLLYVHRDHKDYKGRGAQDGHLDFHTAPEFWPIVQCCFTSTETVGTIRDEEPKTSTSAFTQLLSFVTSMLLYVHRDHKDYQGGGAQDVHLDFHTAPGLYKPGRVQAQCCFTRPQRL